MSAAVSGGSPTSRPRQIATRPLARGDVWLVPACCGAHRIAPEGGDLRLIEMTAG